MYSVHPVDSGGVSTATGARPMGKVFTKDIQLLIQSDKSRKRRKFFTNLLAKPPLANELITIGNNFLTYYQ